MQSKKMFCGILATALVGSTFAMANALDASAVADTYTVSLQAQVANQGFWDDDAGTVSVDGDGEYSVSITYTGEEAEVTAGSSFLMLNLDFNIYDVSESGSLADTGIVITIDSVTCDNTDLNYSGSSSNEKAYRKDDDGKTIRYNIVNPWGGTSQDVSDIDLPFTVKTDSVITVNFTISGLDDAIVKAKTLAGEVVETTTATEATTTTANEDSTAEVTTTTTVDDSATEATTTTASEDSTAEVTTTTTASVDSTTEVATTTTVKDSTTTTTTASNTATNSNNFVNGVYGDMNGDGEANVIDLLILKKYLLGMI